MRHNLWLVLSYSVSWSHWTRKKNAIYGDEIFGMLICIINFSVSEMNFRIFFSQNHHQMFPTKSWEQKNILSIDFIMTKHIDLLYTIVATICRKNEVCYLKRWFLLIKCDLKPHIWTEDMSHNWTTQVQSTGRFASLNQLKNQKNLFQGAFFLALQKNTTKTLNPKSFWKKIFFSDFFNFEITNCSPNFDEIK